MFKGVPDQDPVVEALQRAIAGLETVVKCLAYQDLVEGRYSFENRIQWY